MAPSRRPSPRGERISYRLRAHGAISDLSHRRSVLSFLRPDRAWGDDVTATSCHHVLHFATDRSAREWVGQHPGTFVISLSDATELARRHLTRTFGNDLLGHRPHDRALAMQGGAESKGGLLGLFAVGMVVCFGVPVLLGAGFAVGAAGLALGSGVVAVAGLAMVVWAWRRRLRQTRCQAPEPEPRPASSVSPDAPDPFRPT